MLDRLPDEATGGRKGETIAVAVEDEDLAFDIVFGGVTRVALECVGDWMPVGR
jgi:hypothetical protein